MSVKEYRVVGGSSAGWVGFDLDGTLAHHTPGGGIDTVGDPVPMMYARLRQYLQKGVRCKIFTARADDPVQVQMIQQWCVQHGLPELEVTNVKDHLMLYCYDDRARQVVPNTGIVVGG